MRAMIELIIFTLVLFSCGSPEKPLPRELSRAESMMWEYPDSSLSLLNSISQCSIPDDRSYAIWALLVAQARDKVYGQSLPDSLNIPPSEELLRNALDYFERVRDLRKITHAKELAEIQAKYDFEKLENTVNLLKIEKAHHERIGLVLIICLIAMILIYQYRLLRKRRLLNEAQISLQLYTKQIKENMKLIAENEKRISSLTVQCAEVEGMRKLNDKLRDQNQFLQRRIDASNELLDPLYVNLKDQIPYFDKLMRLGTKPFYLEEKDWPLIRKWVDLQYDRFAERLERDFPDFTKLDMRYCWLIKMGFSSSQIATCMAISPTSSTKQKQRIKQRIKARDLSLANTDFSLDDYIKKY